MDQLDLIFDQLVRDTYCKEDREFEEGAKLQTFTVSCLALTKILNIVKDNKCKKAGEEAREKVESFYKRNDKKFIPLSTVSWKKYSINKLLMTSDLQKVNDYKRDELSTFIDTAAGSGACCRIWYINNKPLCASCNGDEKYVYALDPKIQRYEKYYFAAMAMVDGNLNGHVLMQELLNEIELKGD